MSFLLSETKSATIPSIKKINAMIIKIAEKINDWICPVPARGSPQPAAYPLRRTVQPPSLFSVMPLLPPFQNFEIIFNLYD